MLKRLGYIKHKMIPFNAGIIGKSDKVILSSIEIYSVKCGLLVPYNLQYSIFQPHENMYQIVLQKEDENTDYVIYYDVIEQESFVEDKKDIQSKIVGKTYKLYYKTEDGYEGSVVGELINYHNGDIDLYCNKTDTMYHLQYSWIKAMIPV